MPERKSNTILGKPVPASPPDTSPLNSSMVILAGQNVEKFNKNDKYRIFLIFLDFIFIDLLEWMVSKCQEKRQERTVSKLAIKFCAVLYVLLEKRPEKKFGQFFGRFHREGASSFFGYLSFPYKLVPWHSQY